MGSTGLYLTPQEAAEALGVSLDMVHVYTRRGLLDPHYPNGKLGRKQLRAEDVYALAALRAEHKGDIFKRLPQIAMRAAVTSRRVEQKLDELMAFLGVNDTVLSLESRAITELHQAVEAAINNPLIENDNDIMEWAKKILAINEEYIELLKMHVKTDPPWKPYLELASILGGLAKGRSRMYIEHARTNMRNVAYFYERSFRGATAANKMFPGERYSGRLLQRLLIS